MDLIVGYKLPLKHFHNEQKKRENIKTQELINEIQEVTKIEFQIREARVFSQIQMLNLQKEVQDLNDIKIPGFMKELSISTLKNEIYDKFKKKT